MGGHIHGGPEQVKNAPRSRPDTLMQDRSSTCRALIPLATRGQTIHWGHDQPRNGSASTRRGSLWTLRKLTGLPIAVFSQRCAKSGHAAQIDWSAMAHSIRSSTDASSSHSLTHLWPSPTCSLEGQFRSAQIILALNFPSSWCQFQDLFG